MKKLVLALAVVSALIVPFAAQAKYSCFKYGSETICG